jgi:CBS-domain-containing membrane protein
LPIQTKTIQQAVASADSGVLPVGEEDRLVGMITDRDIAIRGVAQGKGSAKVRDVMTEDVKNCFHDQEVEEVTRNMAGIQVRRLPVLNRNKHLVGIYRWVTSPSAAAKLREMHYAGFRVPADSILTLGESNAHPWDMPIEFYLRRNYVGNDDSAYPRDAQSLYIPL